MMNFQSNIVKSNNRQINILYFSSFGNEVRGGQESLFQLVANLNRKHFNPIVIVPTFEGGLFSKLRKNGTKVCKLELPKILNFRILNKLKTLWKLLKLIRNHRIDIIHTDGPRNTFYAGFAAKIKNIPLIWHVRASNKDRYDRVLTKLSTRIILVADTLRSRFKISSADNKFVTIHNGVDLFKFRPRENKKYVRHKYHIDNDATQRPKNQNAFWPVSVA